MFKKYFNLALIVLLIFPIFIECKTMFEENQIREKKLKSETTALLGSLIVTIVPTLTLEPLLFIPALIVGPSTGHFYAEQWDTGVKKVLTRLGIAAGGELIFLIIALSAEDTGNGSSGWEAYFTFLIGSGVVAGVVALHGLFDIISVSKSVKKYNESILKENSLRIVPEVNPIEKQYRISVVYDF